MEMNPVKDKCVDLAEHYDIDWYSGEFASVFWNRHNTDEFNLEQLQSVQQDCCDRNETWGNTRSRIIARLEQLQGRTPSNVGDPSWLRHEEVTDPSGQRDQGQNIAWVSANDSEMAEAIRSAQRAFVDFAKQLEPGSIDESLVKAYFAHPADPMVGEHIYIDAPSIADSTIQGEVWFESTGIPGIKSGQQRSVDITRLSDWFYIVNGKAHGGYTLPVLASRMDPEELSAACEFPPFNWFEESLT